MKSKRKLSAPQAAAFVLMFVAVVTSMYGAFAGHNVLIVIGCLNIVMAVILWRFKPKK